MTNLIELLRHDFPDINFSPGNTFYWSPLSRTIHYVESSNSNKTKWALLHEVAHAILNHKSYKNDLELLTMEAIAWQRAQEISIKYDINIDSEHVQNCLDTYRNWLHMRSTCPSCGIRTLQIKSNHYRCHNCHTEWNVTSAKFCRPYRKINSPNKKSPDQLDQVTFV